jgi:hypothetical protein
MIIYIIIWQAGPEENGAIWLALWAVRILQSGPDYQTNYHNWSYDLKKKNFAIIFIIILLTELVRSR